MSANGGSTTGAPATGWYCEIVAGGRVHRPSTMDDPAPERNPVARDYPTISIAVRKDEKWQHPAFEDAPMRVWKDGERQEIDVLEETEETESSTILRGRGGTQMDRRYQTEVRQQTTTSFVREAIETRTDYIANIDEPDVEREDDIHLHTAERDGDFNTWLNPDPTDPVTIDDGQVRLAQTCYPLDGFEDATIQSEDVRTTRQRDEYNEGVASLLEDEGDHLRFSFTTSTTIPSDAVGIKIRDEVLGGSSIEVKWDGQLISRITSTNSLGWREVGAFSGRAAVSDYQSAVGTAIEPGDTHELVIEATGQSQHVVDAIALYDRRYDFSWPNPGSGNNGGPLSGPELYPSGYICWFDAPTPPRTVVAGSISVVMSDVDAPDILGLSNTQGEDYGGEGDVSEYSVEFSEPGPSLLPVVTLGRYGSGRDEFPTDGYRTQRLEAYGVRASLANIPMVVNQSYDGSLMDVLSGVADDSNAIFEYRRVGDVESIEWTQPAQRTARQDPSIGSYSLTKSTAERVDKVVIYGGTRDMNAETVVVLDGEEGKTVDLKQSRIKQGSVEVESARTGATMQEGPDYQMRYQDGVLDIQDEGRMDAGTSYDVSYSYQTYGEYTRPGASDPVVSVRNSTGLTSNFAAQQAAKTAVQRLQTPVKRGTLTLTGDEVGYSVVEALSMADLPGQYLTGTDGIQIKEITASPGEVEMRLGNHRSLDDVVSNFERQIGAVEREI